MKKNKIIITGASGSIGSKLLEELSTKYFVYAIYRGRGDKFSNKLRSNKNIQIISLNNFLRNNNSLNNIECIFHTITNYGLDSKDLRLVKEVNEILSIKILNRSIELGVKKFINFNTCLDSRINVYAKTKKSFVSKAKKILKDNKICFIDLSLHNVFGPNLKSSRLIYEFIKSIKNKNHEFTLKNNYLKKDFIYISDLIELCKVLVLHNFNYQKNYILIQVGSGKSYKLSTIVNLLKLYSGSSIKIRNSISYKRPYEKIIYRANISYLKNKLEWVPKVNLKLGLELTYKKHKQI